MCDWASTTMSALGMGLGLYQYGEDREAQQARIDALKSTSLSAIGDINRQMEEVYSYGDTRADFVDATKAADIELVGASATKDMDSVSDMVDATEVASGFASSGELEAMQEENIQDIYSLVNQQYKEITTAATQELQQIDWDTQGAINNLQNQIAQIESTYAGTAGSTLLEDANIESWSGYGTGG